VKILFLGDSLIAYDDWQRRFPACVCVNLGLPGATVADCLARLAEVIHHHPRADMVVVMVGTNNLLMSEFGFLGQYEALVADLRAGYPRAVIAVCSLLPLPLSWLAPGAVARLNGLLKELAKQGGGVYLDICASFMAGGTRDCFAADGVHLSEEGYRRWTALLADRLVTPSISC
jgi:lysophospholipase L1-like esterase